MAIQRVSVASHVAARLVGVNTYWWAHEVYVVEAFHFAACQEDASPASDSPGPATIAWETPRRVRHQISESDPRTCEADTL